MEKTYYNVGNIYGVCTEWDEWESQLHWDMTLEDLKQIGGVLISNARGGGAAGADDVLKDWQDCAEDIERVELEIEDLKCELTDTTNDQDDIIRLADELIERVEEHKDRREDFQRFKRIESYRYDLLVDLEQYQQFTGALPTEDDLRSLLEDYTASAEGELETIRVVEIDKCPNWIEEIADLGWEECDDLGGFKMTVSNDRIWPGNIRSFLMDQAMPLGKRHKIEEVKPK